MTAKRKLSVFLSYAPGDLSAAQTLHDRLTAEGWLDVWFKEDDLLIGQGNNYEIGTSIKDADIAIICISKKATKEAGPFQKQLRLILDKAEEMPQGAIFIIPLKLEECEPPFVLRDLHFANYFENNREKVYPNILRSLQKRANELKISTAMKSAPINPKTPEQIGDTPTEQNNQSAGIDVKGNASNSAIVSGDRNKIHITNNHYYNHKADDDDKK